MLISITSCDGCTGCVRCWCQSPHVTVALGVFSVGISITFCAVKRQALLFPFSWAHIIKKKEKERKREKNNKLWHRNTQTQGPRLLEDHGWNGGVTII